MDNHYSKCSFILFILKIFLIRVFIRYETCCCSLQFEHYKIIYTMILVTII